MSCFIHPCAIAETEHIGEGTRIWAFTHVLKGAEIGCNCNLCDHTFVENTVVIGNNVTIKSGVYIWNGVRIADNVFIGPNVTFTNDLRPRSRRYPDKFIETLIDEGASIGANATIIAGNRIGKYAMIGAGAVVTENIPDNTLWYGNPAKFKGYVCRCGEKLDKSLVCKRCSEEYEIIGNIIKEVRIY